MIKTRLNIEIVNFHAKRMRVALVQRCEPLDFEIKPGMRLDLLPSVQTTGLVSVNPDGEELVGFGRAHVRVDDSTFDQLMVDFQVAGYEVVELFESRHSICGHTGWAPAGELPERCQPCVISNQKWVARGWRGRPTKQTVNSLSNER